ncbi:MAG: FGGY family carbohydrate kinase [Eubacteriales bacterium]|nr:FGGY family carbohydrate kinase [Eubacteriales bacterium]
MKTIGIDIGTTSICAVFYDGLKGCAGRLSAPNHFLEGTACQDADRIVGTAIRLMEELERAFGPAEAVGISSQMHGILYIDRLGESVSPFYTWKYADENTSRLAEELSEATGCRMHAGYGTVTHFSLQRAGALPPQAAGFVNIGDYLAMRLCSLTRTAADPTIAASFGGFDLEEQDFDRDALRRAGVDVSYYPEVSPVPRPVGSWHGARVFAAFGDNQAEFYAAVRRPQSQINVNVGTGAQVSLAQSVAERGFGSLPDGGEVRPFVRGQRLYVQASVGGGKAYERLADFFAETALLLTGQRIDAYAGLERLLEQTEATSLRIEPSLYGSRENAILTGGRMENLVEQNFHPGDFARAYVIGMARELHQLYLTFPEELRRGRTQIAGSGNGMRKNRFLRREVERLFGMPVVFSGEQEEAAAGAAMLAAEAVML